MCRCIFCYIFNTIDIYIYCIKYYPVIIKTQVAFISSLNINLHVKEILKGKAEINQNLIFYSWINNKYKEDKEEIYTTDNCRLIYGRRALMSSVVLCYGNSSIPLCFPKEKTYTLFVQNGHGCVPGINVYKHFNISAQYILLFIKKNWKHFIFVRHFLFSYGITFTIS